MQQPSYYYIDVFVRIPNSIESVQVVHDRRILATCYSKAYKKAIDMLKANGFDFDVISIVIKQIPY